MSYHTVYMPRDTGALSSGAPAVPACIVIKHEYLSLFTLPGDEHGAHDYMRHLIFEQRTV